MNNLTRALQQHGEGAPEVGRATTQRRCRAGSSRRPGAPRHGRDLPGTWSSSAAGPTRGQSQIRETGKAARLPRARGPAGRRLLDPQDLRPAARHVREGVQADKTRCSPCRCTTRWPSTRGDDASIDPSRRTGRSRWSVSSAPTSSSGSRVRSPRSSSRATACCGSSWRSSRCTARPTRRRSASSAGSDSTRRSSATQSRPAARSLGTTRTTRPRTRTSCRRSCWRQSTGFDRDEYDVAEMIAGDLPRPRPDRGLPRRGAEVRAEARRQAQEARAPAQVQGPGGRKVLIFTEFADTARYLHRQLDEAGIDGVAQVDSGTKANRADVIQRFSPYYNGSSSAELAAKGRTEIRVLISTDVLSEGLNLQDASRLINYDIHWNPVRLMQRIGRVDRRMNPEVEAAPRRRPPGGRRIPGQGHLLELPAARRAQRASHALHSGHAEDPADLEDARDRGQEAPHARGRLRGPEGVQPCLRGHQDRGRGHAPRIPGAAPGGPGPRGAAAARFPGRVFSGRKRPAKGARGVFFCYALPALDKEVGEFTEEAGTTRWYLYDLDRDAVLEEPGEIIESIRPSPLRREDARPRRRPSWTACKVSRSTSRTRT